MIRLAHISDLHFGAEDARAMAFAREHILSEAYDLILVAGDLTQNGRREEFQAAANWLTGLPAPKLLTIGNHDFPVFNVFERLIRPSSRYRDLAACAPSVHVGAYDLPLAHLATLRTAHPFQLRPNWSLGRVRPRDLDATLETLQTARQPWKIVMGHHPLIDFRASEVKGEVIGGAHAAKTLQEAGVDLVLSGHIHEPFFVQSSHSHPAAAGGGTLSTRLREAGPSLNRLIIMEDSLTLETVSEKGGAVPLGKISR